jgi:hypothetical protein
VEICTDDEKEDSVNEPFVSFLEQGQCSTVVLHYTKHLLNSLPVDTCD